MRIEDEIWNLAMFLNNPDILPTYNLSFKIRFDSLYYRCRLVVLEESVNMITLTDASKATSRHMLALNEGLRFLTMTEAQEQITAVQTAIGQCEVKGLKRLEVELRLIQASFHLVLGLLGSSSDVDIEGSLEKILGLCTRYPSTAGTFTNAYKQAKLALEGRQTPTDLYAKETGAYWKKWKDYKLGSLEFCVLGHPYSETTFAGCPECGRAVEPRDYNSFLHEDAFLKKLQEMKKQG